MTKRSESTTWRSSRAGAPRTRTRGYVLAALVSIVMTQTGCGGVYYAVTVSSAEARLEQARAMGAESAAPYEYYYAKEHLQEAHLHASEASYGDAASYAETAETYAQKAIDLISAAKRGAEPTAKGAKE